MPQCISGASKKEHTHAIVYDWLLNEEYKTKSAGSCELEIGAYCKANVVDKVNFLNLERAFYNS